MDCAPEAAEGCGFPVNRPLWFAFDRWLHPASAVRQSIRLGPVGLGNSVFFEPAYDVVSRRVSYRPISGWDQGYVFDLELHDPAAETPSWGFRSFDGEWLDTTGLPAHVLFRVGNPEDLGEARPVDVSCRSARQAFSAAGCTAANCHSRVADCGAAGPCPPRAGLDLDSRDGLIAIRGRVAHATDRGPKSGVAYLSGERFGINMPLVQPSDPAQSLILYRMLLDPNAYRRADGSLGASPPTADEMERLRSWLGVMGAMPPAEIGWPKDVSPFDLVMQIQNWVSSGASTADCE